MTGADPARRQREARPRQRDAYTRFVNALKFALPSLALTIIVAALFWPSFVSPGKQADDSAGDALTPLSAVRNFTMEAPVFVATDDNDRPYRLTATRARQENEKAVTIALDDPQAEIALASGVQVRISARHGRYDRGSKRLTLAGNVDVRHGGDYRFRTAEATFDMKTNRAWGGSAVHVAGPDSSLSAGGFLIVDRGMTVIFTGRTRGLLRLAPAGGDDDTAGKADDSQVSGRELGQ